MSEQELQPKEVFNQAVEGLMDEPPQDELSELALDHQPTDDDPDEYWEAFAKDKGWKDSDDIDRANFKGYKAFIRDYDKIQENINLRDEFKGLRKELSGVVNSQQELLESAQREAKEENAKLRQQLEEARNTAFDNNDREAFDKADQKLNELNATDAPKGETKPGEAEIFVNFRNANPELLEGSDAYDPALTNLVQSDVNSKIQGFYSKYGVLPDQDDIQGYLNDALAGSKKQFVKYQEQPTRKPPATNPAKGKAPAGNDISALNTDQRRMYDHLKGKGLDIAAAEFLKGIQD